MFELHGRHALVCGVASPESIAWAIARALHQAGASLSLSYQQRFRSRVLQLARGGEVPIRYLERCDVTVPRELEAFFEGLPGPLDTVVHSIAYARPATFGQPVREVDQEAFAESLVASCYSLVALARAALPHMPAGGSIIALTYLGGQRVVSNYKLMGIAKAALEATVRELAADLGPHGVRVNAISAGPIRTLAASQVAGFDDMLGQYQARAPMRRCVSQSDVGAMATFLASEGARNVTGQVLFVDAGMSILAPM